MVAMAVAMTAAMTVACRLRRGEGGGDGGSAARAAAIVTARQWRRRWRRRGEDSGDGGAMRMAVMAGARGESMDKAGRGGGEEEKTVALCGAGNLTSTQFEEGSGLCVKHPFSGDTA